MTNRPDERSQTLTVLLAIATTLLAILVIAGWELRAWHYFFAVFYLEAQWSEHRPQTREEFEAIICCTRTRPVDPSQSLWGSHRVLRSGEEMIQYGIFGDFEQAFEVVYDRDGNLMNRYSSYE